MAVPRKGASAMTLERLLVNRKQLREIGVCLSYAQLDRLEKRGYFPRRIKLGEYRESRVVYRYQEVLDWIEERAKRTAPLKDDVS
jgi:predicted DNA-binding transcriptional regulator AlpA